MGEEINDGRVLPTTIAGVELESLAVIPADGGPVLKMLSPASAFLPDYSNGFGEIYFSMVEEGRVKAWKRHKMQTQIFAVPVGNIKIVLYDSREDSLTKGAVFATELGLPYNYKLLRIPPGIWYGFANCGKKTALVCNCADIPHDPKEGERLPYNSEEIPWRWEQN